MTFEERLVVRPRLISSGSSRRGPNRYRAVSIPAPSVSPSSCALSYRNMVTTPLTVLLTRRSRVIGYRSRTCLLGRRDSLRHLWLRVCRWRRRQGERQTVMDALQELEGLLWG